MVLKPIQKFRTWRDKEKVRKERLSVCNKKKDLDGLIVAYKAVFQYERCIDPSSQMSRLLRNRLLTLMSEYRKADATRGRLDAELNRLNGDGKIYTTG